MTDTPDYTTMSGAEFQRAVGADPEKWAAAFCQAMKADGYDRMSIALVSKWFRDAMRARLSAAPPRTLDHRPWREAQAAAAAAMDAAMKAHKAE